MMEEAQLAKLYACFRQLSAAHKQEILAKAEALVSAGTSVREAPKPVKENIIETFPLEYDKIIKQRKTPVEKSIESINDGFEQEPEKILKGDNGRKK
jgi:hypothetical protein